MSFSSQVFGWRIQQPNIGWAQRALAKLAALHALFRWDDRRQQPTLPAPLPDGCSRTNLQVQQFNVKQQRCTGKLVASESDPLLDVQRETQKSDVQDAEYIRGIKGFRAATWFGSRVTWVCFVYPLFSPSVKGSIHVPIVPL